MALKLKFLSNKPYRTSEHIIDNVLQIHTFYIILLIWTWTAERKFAVTYLQVARWKEQMWVWCSQRGVKF
jgi:hypothetical protein